MSVFPNWQKYAVHQRRPMTGCIPTAYVMILRSVHAEGIDFDAFQDDFDLDINYGNGQSKFLNNFVSVANAVRVRYEWVEFEQRSFVTGQEKIDFIDQVLKQGSPILISLSREPLGLEGWHIMPVVDATEDRYLLLECVRKDGTVETKWYAKDEVRQIHDRYTGGKEVAFLARLDLQRSE